MGIIAVSIVHWEGFCSPPLVAVSPAQVSIEWLPEKLSGADPLTICREHSGAFHFVVQARPPVENEKFIIYQVRDVASEDGVIRVAVGRVGCTLDPTAYAALKELCVDYIEPIYNVKAPVVSEVDL